MIRCRLSTLLGNRRMHLLELQRQTGIAYSTLHRIYHEKSIMISLSIVDQICKALSVQVGDLFEYVETEEKKTKETKPKKGGK